MPTDTIDQTISALHDAGASDDEITGILKEKFGPKGSLSSTGNEPTDVATESGSFRGSDLLDVAKGFGKGAMNTVVQGGDLLRRATGATRIANTPEVQAITQPSNPAQRLGGMAETTAELIPAGVGVARIAKAAPGMVARMAGMSSARAIENIASASKAAANVAIDANGPGQAGLEALKLKEAGASTPRVVDMFMRRVTDPAKGPLDFEEARKFYSNISRLSADEFGRLNPTMQRAVGAMRAALHTALTDAAGTVGKGEEYASGISEYAKAMKMKSTVGSFIPSPATAAKWAGGGYLTERILRAITGK